VAIALTDPDLKFSVDFRHIFGALVIGEERLPWADWVARLAHDAPLLGQGSICRFADDVYALLERPSADQHRGTR